MRIRNFRKFKKRILLMAIICCFIIIGLLYIFVMSLFFSSSFVSLIHNKHISDLEIYNDSISPTQFEYGSGDFQFKLTSSMIDDYNWVAYVLSKVYNIKFSAAWLPAIHDIETSMGQGKFISPAGAKGHMQFMPDTYRGHVNYFLKRVKNSSLSNIEKEIVKQIILADVKAMEQGVVSGTLKGQLLLGGSYLIAIMFETAKDADISNIGLTISKKATDMKNSSKFRFLIPRENKLYDCYLYDGKAKVDRSIILSALAMCYNRGGATYSCNLADLLMLISEVYRKYYPNYNSLIDWLPKVPRKTQAYQFLDNLKRIGVKFDNEHFKFIDDYASKALGQFDYYAKGLSIPYGFAFLSMVKFYETFCVDTGSVILFDKQKIENSQIAASKQLQKLLLGERRDPVLDRFLDFNRISSLISKMSSISELKPLFPIHVTENSNFDVVFTSPFGEYRLPTERTRFVYYIQLPGGKTVKVRRHTGIDLAVPTGTPVVAAVDGKAINLEDPAGYGYYIMLSSGNYTFLYAHLSKYAKGSVNQSYSVKKGEIIGFVGDSGNAKGSPHLHYEVLINDKQVDPVEVYKFLGKYSNKTYYSLQLLIHYKVPILYDKGDYPVFLFKTIPKREILDYNNSVK